MVIERAVAERRGGAGEVERRAACAPQSACRRLSPRSDWCAPSGRWISAARVAMSTAGSASGAIAAAMSAGATVGRSPWTLTMMPARRCGSAACERLEDTVGTGGVIGAGHHGATAGLLDAGRDCLRIGRDHDRAKLRGLRPPHDVNDHRFARDIGERLAGEPVRSHAGRNENENVGHRSALAVRPGRSGPRQNASWVGRLYGLPEARQTGYLCAAATCGGRWSAVSKSGASSLACEMRANSQTSAQPTGCPIAGKRVPPSIHFLPREP